MCPPAALLLLPQGPCLTLSHGDPCLSAAWHTHRLLCGPVVCCPWWGEIELLWLHLSALSLHPALLGVPSRNWGGLSGFMALSQDIQQYPWDPGQAGEPGLKRLLTDEDGPCLREGPAGQGGRCC